MEELAFYGLQEVLEEYGRTVANLYQDKLISDDKIASGNLLNSVDFLVLRQGQKIWVELHLEEYWKYVENGSKPHWPPVDKLVEWIKIKPVLPTPMTITRRWNTKKYGPREKQVQILPTPQQLAFLIGRKISEKGIEPGYQLKQTLEEVNAEYEQKIRDAAQSDIEKAVDYIFIQYFK